MAQRNRGETSTTQSIASSASTGDPRRAAQPELNTVHLPEFEPLPFAKWMPGIKQELVKGSTHKNGRKLLLALLAVGPLRALQSQRHDCSASTCLQQGTGCIVSLFLASLKTFTVQSEESNANDNKVNVDSRSPEELLKRWEEVLGAVKLLRVDGQAVVNFPLALDSVLSQLADAMGADSPVSRLFDSGMANKFQCSTCSNLYISPQATVDDRTFLLSLAPDLKAQSSPPSVVSLQELLESWRVTKRGQDVLDQKCPRCSRSHARHDGQVLAHTPPFLAVRILPSVTVEVKVDQPPTSAAQDDKQEGEQDNEDKTTTSRDEVGTDETESMVQDVAVEDAFTAVVSEDTVAEDAFTAEEKKASNGGPTIALCPIYLDTVLQDPPFIPLNQVDQRKTSSKPLEHDIVCLAALQGGSWVVSLLFHETWFAYSSATGVSELSGPPPSFRTNQPFLTLYSSTTPQSSSILNGASLARTQAKPEESVEGKKSAQETSEAARREEQAVAASRKVQFTAGHDQQLKEEATQREEARKILNKKLAEQASAEAKALKEAKDADHGRRSSQPGADAEITIDDGEVKDDGKAKRKKKRESKGKGKESASGADARKDSKEEQDDFFLSSAISSTTWMDNPSVTAVHLVTTGALDQVDCHASVMANGRRCAGSHDKEKKKGTGTASSLPPCRILKNEARWRVDIEVPVPAFLLPSDVVAEPAPEPVVEPAPSDNGAAMDVDAPKSHPHEDESVAVAEEEIAIDIPKAEAATSHTNYYHLGCIPLYEQSLYCHTCLDSKDYPHRRSELSIGEPWVKMIDSWIEVAKAHRKEDDKLTAARAPSPPLPAVGHAPAALAPVTTPTASTSTAGLLHHRTSKRSLAATREDEDEDDEDGSAKGSSPTKRQPPRRTPSPPPQAHPPKDDDDNDGDEDGGAPGPSAGPHGGRGKRTRYSTTKSQEAAKAAEAGGSGSKRSNRARKRLGGPTDEEDGEEFIEQENRTIEDRVAVEEDQFVEDELKEAEFVGEEKAEAETLHLASLSSPTEFVALPNRRPEGVKPFPAVDPQPNNPTPPSSCTQPPTSTSSNLPSQNTRAPIGTLKSRFSSVLRKPSSPKIPPDESAPTSSSNKIKIPRLRRLLSMMSFTRPRFSSSPGRTSIAAATSPTSPSFSGAKAASSAPALRARKARLPLPKFSSDTHPLAKSESA